MKAKDGVVSDDNTQALAVLGKVQKLIAEGDKDLSFGELLEKDEVTEKDYINALEVISKR